MTLVATPSVAADPTSFAGRTVAESSPPRWPAGPKVRVGAPNVLVIMTDDVGFAASSAFGGPIPTPHLDALALQGLRYNRFHTAALCSPTRASLLTGRDPHRVGMGVVESLATGYDGYTSVVPKDSATIAQILRQHGYSTAMFGKAHLTPMWEQSQAGPFDRWPTGLGFDKFYGFLGPDTSQWTPALVEGTRFIEPPTDVNYILDRDLADQTIQWLDQLRATAPQKPFFVYYATGTSHVPLHAPKSWIKKFEGRFDQGWDKLREESFERQKSMGIVPANTRLTPRPEQIPAWASLSPAQRKVSARMMEVYAATVAFADDQIGRVLDHLRETGELDRTLVVFVEGDNGPSTEGSPTGALFGQSAINGTPEDVDYMLRHIDEIGGPAFYNHYPAGWAWATATPFQWYKQVASHFGGTRNGLVVSWPGRIRTPGAIRTQFLHVVDIMPTILEATGVPAPAVVNGVPQKSIDGASFLDTFDSPEAPSPRKTQVFEMLGNLGIYYDGWVAATKPTRKPWTLGTAADKPVDVDQRTWELYHVDEDFSQSRDLAAARPEKLRQMQALFWAEAARKDILPIHDPRIGREGRPSLTAGRTEFVYAPGVVRVPASAAPPVANRSFNISADVEVADSTEANGVIVTHGGRYGGYALYLKDGRVAFHYNATGARQYSVEASDPLSTGQHRIRAEFRSDCGGPGAGGVLTILVDGAVAGRGRIEATLGSLEHTREGLDVGEDTGTPASAAYATPARLGRRLKGVTISLEPREGCSASTSRPSGVPAPAQSPAQPANTSARPGAVRERSTGSATARLLVTNGLGAAPATDRRAGDPAPMPLQTQTQTQTQY